MTDIRDTAHVACNCVPHLGPEHCHLCGVQQDRVVPWEECVSPGHVEGTSQNDHAAELLGTRDISPASIVLDQPAELGYRCPVHQASLSKEEIHQTLYWSEYHGFLWCELCDKDYPSALCCSDIDRAIEVFLNSVRDAVQRAQGQAEPMPEPDAA